MQPVITKFYACAKFSYLILILNNNFVLMVHNINKKLARQWVACKAVWIAVYLCKEVDHEFIEAALVKLFSMKNTVFITTTSNVLT